MFPSLLKLLEFSEFFVFNLSLYFFYVILRNFIFLIVSILLRNNLFSEIWRNACEKNFCFFIFFFCIPNKLLVKDKYGGLLHIFLILALSFQFQSPVYLYLGFVERYFLIWLSFLFTFFYSYSSQFNAFVSHWILSSDAFGFSVLRFFFDMSSQKTFDKLILGFIPLLGSLFFDKLWCIEEDITLKSTPLNLDLLKKLFEFSNFLPFDYLIFLDTYKNRISEKNVLHCCVNSILQFLPDGFAFLNHSLFALFIYFIVVCLINTFAFATQYTYYIFVSDDEKFKEIITHLKQESIYRKRIYSFYFFYCFPYIFFVQNGLFNLNVILFLFFLSPSILLSPIFHLIVFESFFFTLLSLLFLLSYKNIILFSTFINNFVFPVSEETQVLVFDFFFTRSRSGLLIHLLLVIFLLFIFFYML